MRRKLAVLGTVLAAVGAGSVLTLPAGADHGRGYAQQAEAGLQFQPGTITTVPGQKGPRVCTAEGGQEQCVELSTPPVAIGTPVESLTLRYDFVILGTSIHFPDVTELAGQLRCPNGTYVPGVELTVQPGDGQSISYSKLEVLVNGQPIALNDDPGSPKTSIERNSQTEGSTGPARGARVELIQC